MPRSLYKRLLPFATLLLLAACAERDPYLRDDVWKPTGSNAGNLAAMVANPRDLIAGRGTTRGDTKASSIAIQHIWDGNPQPLSYGGSGSGASSGSSGSGGGSGGGSSGSAAPSPLSSGS